MSSSKIGFTSYVEIATSMVIQDTDRERLNQSVSKLCGLEQRKNSTPDFAADDIEIHSPRLLKIEWEKRIREWQELLPDRGQPVEECRSLNDFQFCAFFLQHPFVAMSLWNVMQTFYTLDRLVCGTSKESLDRINEWESMQPFEYLEAPRVEKRWRYSLQELLKSIDNSSHQDATTPQPEDLLSGISNIGETMKGGSQDRIKGNTTDTLLRRIDGIYFGISKLENAKRELRRNLRENLKGVRLVDSMLEAIAVAAKRRFSMIDTYLKIDDHHRVASSCPDEPEDVELPGTSNWESRFQNPSFSRDEEPRLFKPLSRTNSMDVVKHQLVIAWVSTRRGDATATAIVLLFVLLVCLHQIQRYLIATSET